MEFEIILNASSIDSIEFLFILLRLYVEVEIDKSNNRIALNRWGAATQIGFGHSNWYVMFAKPIAICLAVHLENALFRFNFRYCTNFISLDFEMIYFQ